MDDKQFSLQLDAVKMFIQDYLWTRCRIKGKLLTQNKEIEQFFKNSSRGREQFERQWLELDTYVKQCTLYGMEYVIDRYKCHIDFQEVEINEDWARITLTTNELKKYKCSPELTVIKEIPHSMLLSKHRGKWFVEEHLTSLEFVDALQFYGKKKGIQDLKEVQKRYLNEVRQMKLANKTYSIRRPSEVCVYKREKALKYALHHALIPEEEAQGGDLDESARFVIRCLEEGGWSWDKKQHFGCENDLCIGDLVKITNLTEGVHSMIVTGYIHGLFNRHKITGYLVSQHGGCERNVPLAVKPYPREYVLVDA